MLANMDANRGAGAESLELIEELNHRVANEFAEALATLSIAATRAPCQYSKASLAQASDKLFLHASLHRSLLRPAAAQANLANHLALICSAFNKAVMAEKGIEIHLSAEDVDLSADRCWKIGLILAELVRNSARHGLSTDGGAIFVDTWCRSDRIMCLVSDTGGITLQRPAGVGQKLVGSLVQELGGKAEWRFTSFGCVVHLDVSAKEGM